MIWRTGIVLAFILAAGVLAYQLGSRVSDEAILTIVGVLCGIMASIPVSIFLLVALTREHPFNATAAPKKFNARSDAMSISDARIREYIIETGTAPLYSATRVWQNTVNGETCVFWQNSHTREIHYAPLREIANGQ